ncbi:hypothetical protein [Streptomyces sp. NPDC002088]|uniref:hypothetical protein n=1 Tax=Streptomyces sp. NPDC002088 TaxID=3154665 RepID=UPI00332C3056
MSIAVRVLNGGKHVESVFEDDDELSLFRFVADAPEASVRWGISEFRDTLFNYKQALQLLREMDEFPEGQLTPVLRKLRESAEWVYKRSGYLLFLGD